MSLSKSMLRVQAKKSYKQQVKGVPKRQRITFAKFFEQYKKMQSSGDEGAMHEDDFDFDDMVSVNTIDDNSIEFEPKVESDQE